MRRPLLWLFVGLGVCVALAGVVVGATALLRDDAPAPRDFYATPQKLPSKPGTLIRSEPFTRDVPPDARAARILYTTTGDDGRPEPASAVVVVPKGRGPWPVVLWNHGTTGIARRCAPSLLAHPFEAGGLFVLPQVIARGWALVAPDYPGLGAAGRHPYLVGRPEARSALDAVRAAREMEGDRIADQTVAWGHSQGGGAALWVGIGANRYAPDIALTGVAALAPASDLVALARGMREDPVGLVLGAYVLTGYSAAYSDVSVDAYLRPAARAPAREVARRCTGDPARSAAVAALPTGEPVFAMGPTDGPLGARLRENVPAMATRVPTLIAQGLDDALIPAAAQRRFARRLCDDGQSIEYLAYPGRDHGGLVTPDSPLIRDLMAWTEARLRGAQPPLTLRCDL